jgi:hypothetical protein
MRDLDIRRGLLGQAHREHLGDADTVIVEELELCVGQARVDVAVVNGKIHGYEIKSERDSLARLGGQATVYSRALDEVTLVVCSNHLDRAVEQIPAWWGVTVASWSPTGVDLVLRRKPLPNPSTDPLAQAQLLWRDEALQILARAGLARGSAGKPKAFLWQKLASELPPETVGEAVRNCLKARGGSWRAASP